MSTESQRMLGVWRTYVTDNAMYFSISVALFLVYCVHSVSADECNLIFSNDREKAQLERLKSLIGKTFNVTYVTDEKVEYEYAIGICTNAVKTKDFEGVAVLQVDKKDPVKHTHILGRYSSTQVVGGDDWVMLKYKDGDPYVHSCNQTHRQAHIMFVCDHSSKMSSLEVLEEMKDNGEECYYLFQIKSSVVCGPPPKETLSGGSIFCIIFFTILAIYLIIGFLYQRIVVGAKGLEQIPNYSFWKEFGRLQADGCDFMCRCGEREDAKAYRGIDDQMLNPETREDRDDRLLPM